MANATTGDLLSRLIQDYDLTGNFYGRRTGDGVTPLRPDWVTIVVGSNMDTDNPAAAIDAQVAGYIYHPGGATPAKTPSLYASRRSVTSPDSPPTRSRGSGDNPG